MASTKSNSFNEEAEQYQNQWRNKNIDPEVPLGSQKGVRYFHILPAEQWELGLWEPIRKPITDYISVSGIQSNRGKNNLKSSWSQCANLFFPFRCCNGMADMLVSFLERQLNLGITSVELIEFEYAAPGNLEPKRLLGETGGKRGSRQTSPDLAVLFGCNNGRSGIYLIENKYTEHNFYNCSGAENLSVERQSEFSQPINLNPKRCLNYMRVLSNPDAECQQILWQRKYWKLLKEHINISMVRPDIHCPALNGGYQLFRQQALAQGIANAGIFDHVVSGVAYDSRNTALINCLKSIGIDSFATGWEELFNTNVVSHCFTHQDYVSWIKRSKNLDIQNWAKYVTERYNYT